MLTNVKNVVDVTTLRSDICSIVVVQDTAKETPKSGGKYVPPQMRRGHGGQSAVTSSGPTRMSRGKKTAPNVDSQEDFPTLGSVADPGYDLHC